MRLRRLVLGAILAVVFSPVVGGQDVTDESRGKWPKEAPGGWPLPFPIYECQMEAFFTYSDDGCIVFVRTIQRDCSETFDAFVLERCRR